MGVGEWDALVHQEGDGDRRRPLDASVAVEIHDHGAVAALVREPRSQVLDLSWGRRSVITDREATPAQSQRRHHRGVVLGFLAQVDDMGDALRHQIAVARLIESRAEEESRGKAVDACPRRPTSKQRSEGDAESHARRITAVGTGS